MNAGGARLEVLAQNFRNPYGLAVDSFGTIFQTDNDDDGNAWTRLNYLMEGGNYGFRGPLNRTWREDHGTHFHAELPGVVPNIARLGAGAPCGLIVYEGTLLPEKYRGQLLHAEAGKRMIARICSIPRGQATRRARNRWSQRPIRGSAHRTSPSRLTDPCSSRIGTTPGSA